MSTALLLQTASTNMSLLTACRILTEFTHLQLLAPVRNRIHHAHPTAFGLFR
jgi:hypothetical protein